VDRIGVQHWNKSKLVAQPSENPLAFTSGHYEVDPKVLHFERPRTTVKRHFPAEKKLSKESRQETLSDGRVSQGKTKKVHSKQQSSQRKGNKSALGAVMHCRQVEATSRGAARWRCRQDIAK
jgi:hypothetical protein